MSDLYQKTMDKQRFIEQEGYKYISIWECDFNRQCKENIQMQAFIDTVDISDPLEPRDAFYGGRTEAFKLYSEATTTQKIKYYDVTSLYPYTNKTGKIPLGHPNIITENFEDINKYEGLIKCKILPPRKLHIPVLPYRTSNKLLFPLCRSCSENKQQDNCQHIDDERAITGTWVSDEIKTTVGKGYRVMKIYEVWDFNKISQYDTSTKTGGLFTEYVNAFLKIKQEASGWPKWCHTLEDKKRYINDYYDKEGILLDFNNIRKNQLAKLMLNSFWGNFGQRANLTQTTYVTDPAIYFDMLTSDSQCIKNVRLVNEEMLQMDWEYTDKFIESSGRTNVVIAAYTTAQARLKLYSYLKKIESGTLYCDTDSIVFNVSPGEWQPDLGDYLGDLTDEVEGNEIVSFTTGGPKNYAFKLDHPDKNGNISCCKVRGITLNFKNSIDINFNTVKEMVTGQRSDKITVVDDFKICRDQSRNILLSRVEHKDYKIVFDKRIIKENYETVPYGMTY